MQQYVKPWTPISQLGVACTEVAPFLFAIAPSTYVFAVDYNRSLEMDANCPYATMIVYAPTVGAAERSLNGQIERDTGEHLDVLELTNSEVLNATYKEIVKLPHAFESARYNYDGKFIEVSVDCENVEYCFREARLLNSSRPYVIRYRPRT